MGVQPLLSCWEPARFGRETRVHSLEDLPPTSPLILLTSGGIYWQEESSEFTLKLFGSTHELDANNKGKHKRCHNRAQVSNAGWNLHPLLCKMSKYRGRGSDRWVDGWLHKASDFNIRSFTVYGALSITDLNLFVLEPSSSIIELLFWVAARLFLAPARQPESVAVGWVIFRYESSVIFICVLNCLKKRNNNIINK